MSEPRMLEISRQEITPVPMLQARPCLVASFELGGVFFAVSRYDDEREWVADAVLRGEGFSGFSHGTGQRSTLVQCMSPEIGRWLDERAADLLAATT